jgi:hypothetical protein
VLETVSVTDADLLEDVIKFKWGDAMRLLFSLSRSKLDFLEAEMNAPGQEVANECGGRTGGGQFRAALAPIPCGV